MPAMPAPTMQASAVRLPPGEDAVALLETPPHSETILLESLTIVQFCLSGRKKDASGPMRRRPAQYACVGCPYGFIIADHVSPEATALVAQFVATNVPAPWRKNLKRLVVRPIFSIRGLAAPVEDDMQLGMVGLGRMGSNMVRRLM